MLFDKSTWGLQYELNGANYRYRRNAILKFKVQCKNLAADNNLGVVFFIKDDQDIDESGLWEKDILARAIFYEEINGNRQKRTKLENKISLDMSDYPSLDNRDKSSTNFIPLEIRLNEDFREDVETELRSGSSTDIMGVLDRVRKKLEPVIQAMCPDFKFKCFRIGDIEVNLDFRYPTGVMLASSEEIALRMSREVMDIRRAAFVESKYRATAIPATAHKYILLMRRLYDANQIAGIPSLQGHMNDHTEFCLYCKQIPFLKAKEDPGEAHLFWLHRAEWKISKNARLKSAAAALDRILPDSGKFHDEAQLKVVLNDLYDRFFEFLQEALNCEYMLTDPAVIALGRSLINLYHPTNSQLVCDALFSFPGRINLNLPYIREDALYRAKNAGVLRKPPSFKGQDYAFDFEKLSERIQKNIGPKGKKASNK